MSLMSEGGGLGEGERNEGFPEAMFLCFKNPNTFDQPQIKP